MAWSVLYDGTISGSSMISSLSTHDAASVKIITYANGMRMMALYDGSA